MEPYKPYNIEDYMTDAQLKERAEQLKFRAHLDKMYKDRYPQTDFCLATDSLSVKEAYQRMIKNPNSDIH